MFQLDVAWWEMPLRAVIIYAALLVLVRVSGKRTVGQFTPFDLLVVLLLSESVSSSLNGNEKSITAGLISATTLIALNFSVAAITSRSKRMQTLVEGRPVLIGSGGKLFSEVLREHHVPVEDVKRALREADCDMSEMQFAFLEADGRISILKASGKRGEEHSADSVKR
ncbi:DUF421 domain-containing protein [Ottowia sp.]|uniref:DUF421 domain-containing protein n=1 Tax=Ottowia sp. TaxID=1898956 RepID=UPI003C78D3B9